MRILVLALMAIGLTGCAATSQWGEAKTGGAVYSYQHTEGNTTCVINGTSAREVEGLEIDIGEGCAMKITTTTSTPLGDVVGVIGGLVNRIPMIPEPEPRP